MLHTNQDNYFMYIVCSFRRIGYIVARKKSTNSEYLTSLRVKYHFEFIHCDRHQTEPISAASRPFHAIAWISEIVAFHEQCTQKMHQSGDATTQRVLREGLLYSSSPLIPSYTVDFLSEK